MAKILIIEDDPSVASSLLDWMEVNGYQAEISYDGAEGLEYLQQRGYDLAIVDWQLPSMSGPTICETYRRGGGKTPLLLLTRKSTVDDKERGLDAGADDYLPKPFDVRELGARVRALLRRSTALFESKVSSGKIVLDAAACKVTVMGVTSQFVAREFALLEFLVRHPGAYFTAEKLIDHVWESSVEVGNEALRTCISRIRSKVDDPDRPSVIENSKGLGYKINDWYLSSD
ncbi:MAG: response regulator transcription factor [Candidatus Obscuribacterales bacterium]|nr:response regulator transcription factor [Candidatus Obscuribacterales bacterium]